MKGGVSCSCRPWQLFSCDALKGDGVEEAGEHRKKEASSGSRAWPWPGNKVASGKHDQVRLTSQGSEPAPGQRLDSSDFSCEVGLPLLTSEFLSETDVKGRRDCGGLYSRLPLARLGQFHTPFIPRRQTLILRERISFWG